MNSPIVRVSFLIACLAQAGLAHAEEPAKPAQPAASPGAPAGAAKPVAPAPATAPSTAVEPRTPEAAAPVAAPPPDVSALSSELSAVLDELIQARSRASILAKSLFRTRIDINVLRRADDQQLLHVKLALDGVPVHESDGAALAGSEAHLFSGYVAPGVHEISIEINEQARENATYRYTRAERFRIETKKDTSTQVDVTLRDDSDMAEELPEGDDGKYEVSTRVRVTPVKVKD
jgi:hypothetical protein